MANSRRRRGAPGRVAGRPPRPDRVDDQRTDRLGPSSYIACRVRRRARRRPTF